MQIWFAFAEIQKYNGICNIFVYVYKLKIEVWNALLKFLQLRLALSKKYQLYYMDFHLIYSYFIREAIQEDDSGRLEPSVTDMIRRAKRRKLLDREASVRLGIMRHVFIILDLSQAMAEQDLKPTRQICTLKVCFLFDPLGNGVELTLLKVFCFRNWS